MGAMNNTQPPPSDDASRLTAAVQRMLVRTLKALARTVLRQNLSYPTFEKIAKQAFIEVAREDHGVNGRPANKSRIALITGINRRDVARQLDDAESDEQDPLFNPIFRLVSLWIREPEYLDKNGEPAVLSVAGEQASIESLQKKSCPDMPVTAVVRALVAGGLAEFTDAEKSKLTLISHGYIPQHDLAGKYEIMGIDTAALLRTFEHNIHSGERPLFQRRVSFANLSPEGIAQLQQLANEKGLDLLVDMDAKLSQQLSDEEGCYAGMGIYVFVDQKQSKS